MRKLDFRFLSILLFLLAGCSASTKTNPNQMFVEIRNAPHSKMDPEVERQSQMLHHYLSGQIAYSKQEFSSALENFAKASDLVTQPVPILSSKLAELYVRNGDIEKALKESTKAVEADPNNPDDLFLYAGVLDAAGQTDKAEQVYRSLIEKDGSRVDAYVLLSSLYIRRQEFDKSIALLKTLMGRPGNGKIAEYYLGRVYELKGDLPTAEKNFYTVYKQDTQIAAVVADLLRVYLKQGKIKQAHDFCNEVLKRDPGNLIARRVLSNLLIGEERFDEALKHLQVLESVENDATDTRFKIAVIQLEKQNSKEALRELNLVLASKPDHHQARYYLASLYSGEGRVKDALTELEKIPSESDVFVKAKTYASFLMKQEGDLKGAERGMRQALESDPRNKELISYLVVILRESGELNDAAELLEGVIKENPQDEKLLFSYGVVLHDLERTDDSQNVMQQVLVINPKHADALNFRAYSFAEAGEQLDSALTLAQQALSIRPDDPYFLDTLGWIYYRMARYEEAVRELEKAVKLSGSDSLILEHFGDALVKVNSYARAIEIYRASVSALKDDSGQSNSDEGAADRINRKLHHLETEEKARSAVK